MPGLSSFLLLYLATILAIVVVFLWWRRRNAATHEAQPAAPQVQGGGNEQVNLPVNNGNQGGRRRDALARMRQRLQAQDNQDEAPNEGVEAKAGGRQQREPREGKRLTIKEQKKLYREQQRMEREAKEQNKKAKDDLRAQARKKKADDRLRKEKAQEEEDAKRIEEEKDREKAEFDEWKGSMSTEELGSQEQKSEFQLTDFLQYIKSRKVTPLADIGAEFQLKTDEVVSRIKLLEDEGLLTGVIDDRGKYIYITAEELDAVANFIKKRGRFTAAELVSESNALIDLSPSLLRTPTETPES